VPTDSRLPDGGGYTLTGMALRAGVPATDYFVTLSNNYGKMTEHSNNVNITVNARLQNGLLLQGGTGTQRQVTSICGIADQLPEMLHTFLGNPTRTFVFSQTPNEYCEANNGWRTSVQGLAAYTIPKVDVQVSGTIQNLPGGVVTSNYNVGGGLFPGGPFQVFNIVDAGALYVERLNQIDLRFAKIFRFGGTRTNLNFDFYNILNANSVISENSTYGVGWRTPTVILSPRLFKIGVQFDF
jgi:hypothetical protein